MMAPGIGLAERGILPDRLVRLGIRQLMRQRLKQETTGSAQEQKKRLMHFIGQIKGQDIAVETAKANEQHYELPPEFFRLVLGKHLKYSCCWFRDEVDEASELDDAEADMLNLTCQRAQLEDGKSILELGCGWGSLSLWMAGKYPNSHITVVSNSAPQGRFIKETANQRGFDNLEVITADMKDFDIHRSFDRIVSVEMFEHMRNYQTLMERIASWCKIGGKLFVHIFTHRSAAYLYQSEGNGNWMGRYFFTGGMMPSDDLLLYFQDDFSISDHWIVNGTHYRKTADAWLHNMKKHRSEILKIMAEVYGPEAAGLWYRRWRIFFMACSELWGFRSGDEWFVSHYLFDRD